jgi:DNA-binding transcriptional LysR family regulator
MRLTAGGRVLAEKAGKILVEVKDLVRLGQTLRTEPAGTLRIGLNRSAEFLRISSLYRQIKTKYPHVEIILHQSISGSIIRSILTDALDCGFILGRCNEAGLVLEPLARFALRVVGPVSLQDELESASLEDLAGFPWIGIPDDAPYSRIMKKYFSDKGLHLQTEVIADQQSAIVSMIESGAGLSFMLDAEARQAQQQGKVALWPGRGFPIDLYFIYRAGDNRSLTLQVIRKLILDLWEKRASSQETTNSPVLK